MNMALGKTLMHCLYVVFVALWIPMTALADATNATSRIISDDEVSGLLRAYDLQKCQDVIDRWKRALPFQKLALAEELVGHLRDTNSCPEQGSSAKDGGNDTAVVAGRAKWALEQIMNVQLEDVKRSTPTNALAALQFKAVALVENRRKDVMSEGGKRTESDVAEKYKGKITLGVAASASQSAVVLQELLAEWSPLGRRIEDLAAIIGSRGENTEDGVSYRFDTGYGGFEFRFRVNQGIIASVKVFGIE